MAMLLVGGADAGPIPCYDVTAIIQDPDCPSFPLPAGGILAIGVNASNVVLGHVSSCPLDDAEPFLWTTGDGFELIPWPPTAVMFKAFGLNDDGVVVGYMNITDNEVGNSVAFIYDRGTITSLGTLPGGDFSDAVAVNNLNHVAGNSGNTFVGPPHAVAWIGGTIIDIGADLPTTYTTFSRSADINDSDLIVGHTGGNQLVYQRGFVWDKGRVTVLDVAPGGTSSRLEAVNNRGQAIGKGLGEPLPTSPITTYPKIGFLWERGQLTVIEPPPGFIEVEPLDINDDGIVVGQLGDAGTSSNPDHGFVWRDGVLRDIHDLVDVLPNLNISSVAGVNEAGVLVANAKTTDTNLPMVLLLTPKPAQPADLTGDCHVDGDDLTVLLQSWGPIRPAPAGRGAGGEGKRNANPAADLDGNGVVNGFDLAMLLAAWG